MEFELKHIQDFEADNYSCEEVVSLFIEDATNTVILSMPEPCTLIFTTSEWATVYKLNTEEQK